MDAIFSFVSGHCGPTCAATLWAPATASWGAAPPSERMHTLLRAVVGTAVAWPGRNRAAPRPLARRCAAASRTTGPVTKAPCPLHKQQHLLWLPWSRRDGDEDPGRR
jgi:hypothetical protein